MARIIAICGKICSGKTYYAGHLLEKERAVLLSIDEATFALIHNEQGVFYPVFAERVNQYLRKKAAEIVRAGCNVVLDWGFWTKAERKEITDSFAADGIAVEWHYVSIEPSKWEEQIEERNQKIEAGNGGCSFYVDEGLRKKLLSRFEEPAREEIDVWVENRGSKTL